MPRTVHPDDRKTPYAVSLSMKQRETFQKVGGSRWLQAKLDALELRAAQQPKKRGAA